MSVDSINRTVLLINPRATYVNEIAQKCFPPMNLLYLAAALRNHGFDPVVLDANAFRMSDEQIEEEIVRRKPLVVGLSVYTEILKQIRDLTRLVDHASPGTRIVLGGPHINAIPRRSLEQFTLADYILLGECEFTFPMLCEAIYAEQVALRAQEGDGSGRPVDSRAAADPPRAADVPGVFYREDGRIVQGPEMALPEELDKIPWPARDLVARAYEEKRYYSILVRRMPVDTLFTSRGCPFHCGFCYNFRFRYRPRKPEEVVHELATIRDRGIRDVEICDDTFTANRPRAIEIFDLILKHKLDISFRIKSRVDVFTEDLAKKAREAGVYLVAFGTESGSQRMLDTMNKKIKIEQSARAIGYCHQYGMLSHTSWIIGYPGETRESVQETLDFILKHRPSTANVGVLRPYPETEAYRIAAETGCLMGDWDPDSNQMPWVRLPWAQDKKVLDDLYKRIMRQIYFTPYYMASFANQIVRGANLKLGRYAIQETLKVLGLHG